MNSIGDRTIDFVDDNERDLILETRPITQDIKADIEDHGNDEGPLADELLEHIEQAEVDDISTRHSESSTTPLLKMPMRRSAKERTSKLGPGQTPRDSRWGGTPTDMRNTSAWDGENRKPKTLAMWSSTELSRGLRAT